MASPSVRRTHTLLIVVGLLLAFCAGCWASDFMAQDSCLDAGGRWGPGGVCEGVSPRS